MIASVGLQASQLPENGVVYTRRNFTRTNPNVPECPPDSWIFSAAASAKCCTGRRVRADVGLGKQHGPSGISWRRLIYIGHGRRDPDAEESVQVLGYAGSECKLRFGPSVTGCIQAGLNQN